MIKDYKGKIMNREINFRGKTLEGNKWLYGNIQIPTPPFDKYLMDDKDFYNWQKEVDKDTVGQFTGLVDKNKVNIFHGDIFKIGPTEGGKVINIYEVRYDSFLGTEIRNITDLNKNTTHYGSLCEFAQLTLEWWEYFKDEAEIIGNIYDNPELIR